MAAFCFAFYESYISMMQTERGGEMGRKRGGSREPADSPNAP
jgi:hypothetical protein